MLTERTGMSNVFFANGGGESNEGAIKLARKYAFDRYGTARTNIVTLYQSFHGRTVTTLSATGQEVFHNYFFPFTQGFRYAKANDLESVKAACGDDTCAVMLELIQGEGGVLPLDYDFVQQVKAFCEQKDMLLIVDEVQTGVGRTGSLFAFQQYDILPDIVSFAKGIAGGLPFGGVMAGEKCRDVFTPGTHATTFGGNPIAAAAACHVLSRMTPELLESVARKGAYLTQQILDWKLPCVKGVRGKGLMLGVALEGKTPGEVARACAGQGLLILTAGSDALRMLPPLVITKEEMDDGLAVLKAVLEA
jgi:acetylornithine/N-succinyldiaminopimelate aminotransferase